MNTNDFANLCELLQVHEGLKEDGHVSLAEHSIIRIQSILFAKDLPVEKDCMDPTYSLWFLCVVCFGITRLSIIMSKFCIHYRVVWEY
ncbi:hypothetical protein AHAS_Ahas18G0174600 [Arachis hypogaea]